ncbi:DnaJ domain-containing protein [Quillaja saponaria]|uniref:DnaJ domain-containing protein n=1 Tax=Quillaja saponaria TaxID=32244 RepID=A0AAD7LIX7_QUISA|nr:DnaJ domain-containing protein [Quillaja saponaria]KAJ7958923.1 DnaJ domain-containing protein [Quillaja saponaria]
MNPILVKSKRTYNIASLSRFSLTVKQTLFGKKMENSPNRAEAERLLGIAEKLLQSRDFTGSRDFSVLAQETEPLLEGSDQILAVLDVLLAADRRINNHHDWYAILQVDRRSEDIDFIKKQYRRLALLLHPDKNRFSFADHAFKLVADAWAVLSDQGKKSLYDKELSLFSRVDLAQQGKLPVRRVRPVGRNNSDNATEEYPRTRLSTFWTACPYCYLLYEYPRVYEGCCLKCQNCQRSFHGVLIQSLPPLVPGQEAYYCCWGFFPMGYTGGNWEIGGQDGATAMAAPPAGFPNWMPPVFSGNQQQENVRNNAEPPPVMTAPAAPKAAKVVDVSNGRASVPVHTAKKRGRPRKYPVQS